MNKRWTTLFLILIGLFSFGSLIYLEIMPKDYLLSFLEKGISGLEEDEISEEELIQALNNNKQELEEISANPEQTVQESQTNETPISSENPTEKQELDTSEPSAESQEQEEEPPQREQFPVIFRAFHRATISSKVTTTVLEITRRMGENFTKGDLLIRMDDTVFVGLKRKAEGALAKGKAELYAKEQLFKEDIASLFEVKTAEANVAQAESDLISAQYAIEACYIIAPYNGKVVTVFVEEHELIQEAKPLIEIVNDEWLIGQVLVPANLFSSVRVGQVLEIYVQETGQTVIGHILRVDAVIDPASSFLKIDIVVDNFNNALRAGMIGQTTLEPINEKK